MMYRAFGIGIRLGIAATIFHSSLSAAEGLDTFLGEAYEGPSASAENAVIQQLAEVSLESLKRKYPENAASPGPVPRDVHGKSHGCAFGSFTVKNEFLPESLKVGLFEENREYKTILRYSSNSQDPHYEDARADIRGLGVKVLNARGIPGLSQDFLFLGMDTLFIPNNNFYVEFLQRLLRDNPAKFSLWFAVKYPKLAYSLAKAYVDVGRYFNPKDVPFFSAVALRLGARTSQDGHENFNRRAVKYKLQEVACKPNLKPVRASKQATDLKDPDFLSKSFKNSLAEKEICLSLSILIRTQKDTKLYPVEDATIRWNDEYRPVAEIRLRPQPVDTADRVDFCENLRFSPWNTLPEHRPLGRINRARKVIYEAIANYRNSRNGVREYREPTDF